MDKEYWLTKVELYEGESISHFLGRFRRAKGNRFSAASGLGQVAGLGAILVRWEKLYFNPFPSDQELEALAQVVMLDVEDLRQMLPQKGMITQPKPIMLCAACYGEKPYHRMAWQDKHKRGCEVHGLELLSRCINCKTLFPIPSKWDEGKCKRCSLPFAKMAKHQKTISSTQRLT
ncbi:MAG: TniQ family protein [Crocosphaera sp.]